MNLQLSLGSLPINLILIPNGTLAFVPRTAFKAVIDDSGGMSAIFDSTGFSIEDEQYQYGVAYPYKTMPNLLCYLQKQNLQLPKEGFI